MNWLLGAETCIASAGRAYRDGIVLTLGLGTLLVAVLVRQGGPIDALAGLEPGRIACRRLGV